MKKIDDRFLDFNYSNPNSITADDIYFDESNTVKQKLQQGPSGGHTHNGIDNPDGSIDLIAGDGIIVTPDTTSQELTIDVDNTVSRLVRETLSSVSWNGSGPYYQDVNHNLGARPVQVQCFNSSDYKQIIPSDVELTSDNICRIYSVDNSISIHVIVVG